MLNVTDIGESMHLDENSEAFRKLFENSVISSIENVNSSALFSKGEINRENFDETQMTGLNNDPSIRDQEESKDSMSFKFTEEKIIPENPILSPREYQTSIVENIFKTKDHFGRIISLETGLGKTFIVVIYLCKSFGIDYSLAMLSIKNRKKLGDLKIKKANSRQGGKTVIFLVPTKNLLDQQFEYFNQHLPETFDVVKVKSASDFSYDKKVFDRIDRPTFILMIHKVCLTLLRNGSMKIEEIDYLIFDECHHAQKEHPYNLIMREFYFYGLDFKLESKEDMYKDRPYILGLTASPIKSKIKETSTLEFKFEMLDQLKELCSNLNSKLVSTDIDHVDESLKRKLDTEFIEYSVADYWKSIDFITKPHERLPKPSEMLSSMDTSNFTEKELSAVVEKIEILEKEIFPIVQLCHDEMIENNSELTSEKITQIIGNTYKDVWQKMKNTNCNTGIAKVALLLTLSFYTQSLNIVMNVGVAGLQIFIEETLRRFKSYKFSYDNPENKNIPEELYKQSQEALLIHKYLKRWSEFANEIVEENRDKLLSPKVERMILTFLPKDNFEILDQIIIFVDQRLIADLLYKSIILHLTGKKDKGLFGVVYSHSNRNNLSKIVKKLSSDQEDEFEDIFSEILDIQVSQNMSIENQKDVLSSFKQEKCKVLISTNVIEEGLDIPSCNQIIVYDKIATPKTFIQMSGRARQKNSKIYFMCDAKEIKEIKENVNTMEIYKELLWANDRLARIEPLISPLSCTYPKNEIFIIEATGARVSIDGSLDQINSIIQKLSSINIKVGKLKEIYDIKKSPNFSFS